MHIYILKVLLCDESVHAVFFYTQLNYQWLQKSLFFFVYVAFVQQHALVYVRLVIKTWVSIGSPVKRVFLILYNASFFLICLLLSFIWVILFSTIISIRKNKFEHKYYDSNPLQSFHLLKKYFKINLKLKK